MRETTLRLTLTTLLVVPMIAGCHAQPCGGCRDYETCDVVTQACVLNAGTRFDLVADDGNVPGDNWDPFFGPPDPYICASAGGPEACTSPQSDDSTPTWNQQLLAGLDGDALEVTPIAVRYEDSDVDSPDLICQGAVTVTPQYLHDGGFVFHCGNGASARFSLENVDRGTPTVATR
jgi:hypothetical protein